MMKRALTYAAIGLAVLGATAAWWTRTTSAVQPNAPQYELRANGPALVLQLPWGPGGQSLGRHEPDEASPLGPMSFAPGNADDLWVLDQVNARLARFSLDGALLAEVPLPSVTCEEFELLPDGTLVLLDRLVRDSLVVMDPSGQTIREEALQGQGIPDGGGVSAMFVRPDGVWVEFEHTHMVRVLDEKLQPADRVVLPGRALDAQHRVVAALDGQGGATLRVRDADGNTLFGTEASFEHPIDRIVWVEAARDGSVLALFHLMEFGADPYTVAFEGVRGILFDKHLHERGVLQSPYVIRRWEQFREFRLEPDGTVWQMAFTEAGVVILRWRWS